MDYFVGHMHLRFNDQFSIKTEGFLRSKIGARFSISNYGCTVCPRRDEHIPG